MAKKRMVSQFGLGTSLRGHDYTAAALLAVRDALGHNVVSVAEAFGFPAASVLIDVEIGVQQPAAVDRNAVRALFPAGQVLISVVRGGLDLPSAASGDTAVVANAAVLLSFDMETNHG